MIHIVCDIEFRYRHWKTSYFYLPVTYNQHLMDPIYLPTSMSQFLVCSSQCVLLPETDIPQPATVVVDISTGKITDIRLGTYSRSDLTLYLPSNSEIAWVDAKDKIILPGLIEYVSLSPVNVSKQFDTCVVK